MQQEPLQERLSQALLNSSILSPALHPLPPFCRGSRAQHPEVAFMFLPPPQLIVVTPWAHFVLHLIPFERGHWRIAGENRGEAAGQAQRHTNKQKPAPRGEIASTAAGL